MTPDTFDAWRTRGDLHHIDGGYLAIIGNQIQHWEKDLPKGSPPQTLDVTILGRRMKLLWDGEHVLVPMAVIEDRPGQRWDSERDDPVHAAWRIATDWRYPQTTVPRVSYHDLAPSEPIPYGSGRYALLVVLVAVVAGIIGVLICAGMS